MKNIPYYIIIVLVAALIILLTKYNKAVEGSSIFKQEVAILEEQAVTMTDEKSTLLVLVSDLQDSLAIQKAKIEYIYIEVEEAAEYVADIDPNDSYNELNYIYPEEDTSTQVYPFSGVQVQDLHLAVIERTIYGDLTKQYQEALETSDDIIDLQNQALLKADSILAINNLQQDIMLERIKAVERKVKKRGRSTAILGGVAGVELLLLLIILI